MPPNGFIIACIFSKLEYIIFPMSFEGFVLALKMFVSQAPEVMKKETALENNSDKVRCKAHGLFRSSEETQKSLKESFLSQCSLKKLELTS